MRIPDVWKAEIAKGTSFGVRAQRAVSQAAKPTEPRRSCSGAKRGKCADCSNLGTLLTAAIETETGQRITCGTCRDYLTGLNRTAAHDAAAIVQKLYAEISWPRSWRAIYNTKDAERQRIGEIVATAMQNASTTCAVKPVRQPQGIRRSHKASTELYHRMTASPRPERDPFTAQPTFHFGAHLWPVAGYWEHHVDLWNKLADQITGKCIVGIAECEACGTSPTEDVIARLSSRFEVFVVPNTKEGENPTFTELVKRMPKDENDIMLYAHGKGVKPTTRESAAVKVWVQIMYSTVIFNQHEIVRRFAQGYKTFGSLRAFGKAPLSPTHSWHYAGTFFAVRSKYLHHTKPVKPGYGGVEAWPGDNFPANEAWCEFGDNRLIMSHYDAKEMCSDEMGEAVAKLRSQYARRHRHRKLIAVTTCNLYDSQEIRNDIRVTLDSIAEHCSADVLVVDDGSPLEYQEYVHDLCKRRGFRFIRNLENGGISRAKNICLDEFLRDVRYEYCFLLDDDVKVLSDDFESTYTTTMESEGLGILSWNDPAYTGTNPEVVGSLSVSNHTCGCCVVVSRECVQATGFYKVMPGKWGREHSEYYQRAAANFAKPGVYYDVPHSKELLALVSNASVFTHAQKLKSNEINRVFLASNQ